MQTALSACDGKKLFGPSMSKANLERMFGVDEGGRLYSQILVQRNRSGVSWSNVFITTSLTTNKKFKCEWCSNRGKWAAYSVRPYLNMTSYFVVCIGNGMLKFDSIYTESYCCIIVTTCTFCKCWCLSIGHFRSVVTRLKLAGGMQTSIAWQVDVRYYVPIIPIISMPTPINLKVNAYKLSK